MIIQKRFERATSGLGLCKRRQSGLNVLSDGLPGLVASLIKRQVFDRPQGAALSMRLGHDPSFVSRGLHSKNQTTNLSVSKLVRAIPGFCSKNNALRECG